MPDVARNSIGKAVHKGWHGLIFVFGACILTGCTHIPEPSALRVVRILTDPELDMATAGAVGIRLDLAASADGSSAVTTTEGTIKTAHTTVLRIELDPSAPPEAAARLIDVSTADFVYGVGKAQAAGTENVQCSATPMAFGTATITSESRTQTSVFAGCSCAAVAIGTPAR